MTCQECERKLGMGEDAEEHLASCAECRGLAEDLHLNAIALGEMREIQIWPRVLWAGAALAAAVVMAVSIWRMSHVERLMIPPARIASAADLQKAVYSTAGHGPAPHRRARAKRQAIQPLQVKMFTSDPDVVIYWIVDGKAGSE